MAPSALVLYLAAGLLAGACLVLLASWEPLRIVDEDARWQAMLLDQPVPPRVATWQTIRQDLPRSICGNAGLVLFAIAVTFWAMAGEAANALRIAQLPFLWSLAVLGLIDWRTRLLPDVIVLPVMWLGLLVQVVIEQTSLSGSPAIGVSSSVMGAVAGYLLMWLPARTYQWIRGVDAMGPGDMKMMALAGAWLGPAPLLPILLSAFVLGAAWQGVALLRRKAGWAEEFALGPWIVLATLGTVFLART